MNNNTYCPFSKEECRSDCMFRINMVATDRGFSKCLIAVNLCAIENQATVIEGNTSKLSDG